MRIQVIYNPVAGQHDVTRSLDEVLAYLRDQGSEVTLRQTFGGGDATTYAREAVAQHYDMVIAAGGDGTVGEVVNGLVGSECVLGVLPVGTANVWARTLGLPLWSLSRGHSSLLDAAKVLMSGEVQRIDLGKCHEHYFLLWSGIGFDAEVTRQVEPHRELRRNLGNLTYYVTMLAMGITLRGTRMTIVIDGKAMRQRAFLIVVFNVQLYGGSVMVAPEALLDDGYLDVYVFKGGNALDAAGQLINIFAGRHLQDPSIERFRARSVSIRGDKPLPLHIDGDPCGYTPADITVVPKAIRVMMPQSASPSLFEGTATEPQGRSQGAALGWLERGKQLYADWEQRIQLPPRD